MSLDDLSPHDRAEMEKFQAFLKRRVENPEEPAFHSYAEIYGEIVHVHPGERGK